VGKKAGAESGGEKIGGGEEKGLRAKLERTAWVADLWDRFLIVTAWEAHEARRKAREAERGT
jgi:hypothetical protein